MPLRDPIDVSSWRSELLQALERSFVPLSHAIVFGSVAGGTANPASDIDVAVAVPDRPLSSEEKLDLIERLAEATGRPVDLVDLRTVGEPLLGEILRNGVRLIGSDEVHTALLLRHLYDEADFSPLQRRILTERRQAWIGA